MLYYVNMNRVPVALPAETSGMKTETGGEDAPPGNSEIKLTLSLMLAHVVAVWTQCNSNQPGLFGTKIYVSLFQCPSDVHTLRSTV